MYSEIVLDHFRQPRCQGRLDRPDGQARLENPVCGDVAEFDLQIEEGRIRALRFRAVGCVAAVASCSRLAELAEGMTLDRAATVTKEALAEALGGLPASKRHGAALAVDTLRAALKDFLKG